MLTIISNYTAQLNFMLVSNTAFLIVQLASLVLLILMLVWRLSYSGRFCSGDFLGVDQKAPDYFLVQEGRYIGILIAVLLVAHVFFCVFLSCVRFIDMFFFNRPERAANITKFIQQAQVEEQQKMVKAKKHEKV